MSVNPGSTPKGNTPPGNQAIKKKKKDGEPDGSLGCFYIETPCPNMPFYDYSRSQAFKQLREDEQNLVLAKKHPMNPYVTAEVEVKGVLGKQVMDQALVVTSDEDGAIELPPEEEEFAITIYEKLANRFGEGRERNQVRLHPKSLPFKSRKPVVEDLYAKQQARK